MSLKKIRSTLSMIKHFPSYPGIITPDTTTGLNLFDFVSTTLNAREHKSRKLLSESFENDDSFSEIKVDDGFLIEDMAKNPIVKKAVAHVKKTADSIDWELKANTSKKAFLINHKFDLFDPKNEALLNLATLPEILKPISQYLGTFPILSSAAIWYSPNKDNESLGSQLYHLDGEDIRQVKCFLPIDEIDLDSGPLTILPANTSEGIYKKLRQQKKITRRNTKLDDQVVYEDVDQSDAIKIVGKPGTVAFIDTCRCYHYGSRSASKPRLLLHLHFFSSFSRMMPLWGRNENELPALMNGNRVFSQALIGKSHLAFSNARLLKNS